jgi:O-antigen chain-terminating methyltransferase
VQQRVQHDITAVEELLQEVVARNAQTGQQLYDQIGQVFALVDGLEQRLAGLESQTSSLEQQLNRAREDVRIVLQPTLIKLDQRTEATIGDVAEASNRLDRELAEVRAGMQQGLAVVEERRREEAQRAQALVAATSQLSRKVSHELEEMRVRVLRAERKIRVARQPQAQRLLAAEPGSEDLVPAGFQAEAAGREVAMPVIAAADPDAFDYFLFEHRYRGTREDIQQRQAAYLNLFRDRQNVVDVGCGRGEFVELLQQNGIPVTGVDINPDMVELCQDRGLPVVLAHMFDYLQGLPDASLDGIFSAQVVEHISPQQILTLFQLCAQKLKSGGVVVMETVNPNCPYALGNFYLDPTHVRPAPARLLAFIAEQSLFKVQSLKFSAPVADSQAPAILEVTSGWPEQVSLYQDYAVVASKL